MSVFPKRNVRGGKVILHTSLLFEKGIIPYDIKCEVINPLNSRAILFERKGFFFQKDKNNYLASNANQQYTKGHSGLIYANFIKDTVGAANNMAFIFERLTLAQHDYQVINITNDFPLGKYTIATETLANGITQGSKTKGSDFFYVEELVITEQDQEYYILNKSPENTPFRLNHIDQENNLKEILVTVKGHSSFKIPKEIDVHNAWVIHAEDQHTFPVTKGEYVYRNPMVQAFSEGEATFLNYNEDECYILKGDLQKLWIDLGNIRNKEYLLKKHRLTDYEGLLANKIICEIAL